MTQKGRVTNNTAIDILSNPTAINTLTQEAGLNISEDMSKSQQRKAVKNAVATLARTQSDVSTNARETAPAATEARQAAHAGDRAPRHAGGAAATCGAAGV